LEFRRPSFKKCVEIDIGHSAACRDVGFARRSWKRLAAAKEARFTIASVGFLELHAELCRGGVFSTLDSASQDLIGFVSKLNGPHPQLLDQSWFDRGP
jgi:hypothetical protein